LCVKRCLVKTMVTLTQLQTMSRQERLILAYDACLPIYDRAAYLTDHELTQQLYQQLGRARSTLPNPFGDVGTLPMERFWIRQPLMHDVFHELRKGNNVSLVGVSGTGKSSFLTYLHAQSQAELQREAIYLDLQMVNSDSDFFEYLCAELAIATCRSFYLQRQLRQRQIVVCLDEIEQFKQFTCQARTELRALADGQIKPLKLVIASRSPLAVLFPDNPNETSPLAGICWKIDMPPFTINEAIAFAEHRLQPLGLSLPRPQVMRAWERSQGHPQRLQHELKLVFEASF